MRSCREAVVVFSWIVFTCAAASSQVATATQPKPNPSSSMKTGDVSSSKAAARALRPPPEMQKLSDAFSGNWRVRETFEISSSLQGKTREGVASFRVGPGFSLIEDYKSNGSAGELNFLALLWWDKPGQVYRLLTCANNDGCGLRGTVKWEGNALVNSWREEIHGKPAILKDSFVDISPSGFRLVSEGSANGKIIWRVITEYKRMSGPGKDSCPDTCLAGPSHSGQEKFRTPARVPVIYY